MGEPALEDGVEPIVGDMYRLSKKKLTKCSSFRNFHPISNRFEILASSFKNEEPC